MQSANDLVKKRLDEERKSIVEELAIEVELRNEENRQKIFDEFKRVVAMDIENIQANLKKEIENMRQS